MSRNMHDNWVEIEARKEQVRRDCFNTIRNATEPFRERLTDQLRKDITVFENLFPEYRGQVFISKLGCYKGRSNNRPHAAA